MQFCDEKEKYFEVVPLKESGGQAPLFCLPGAGGEVSIFREMASLMKDNESVYAINMRKFFDADCKFTVERLADLCLSVIKNTQTRGPYHFCGYSFGALVAYEVANRLKRDGESVRVVAMIDTGNPAFGDKLSAAETSQVRKTYFSNRIAKYLRLLISGDIRKFAGSLAAFFASRAGVGLRRLVRSIFIALGRPMPDLFRTNDRKLFEAWSAYKPPPSALPLLLFYGEYRRGEYRGDPTLGWNLCASGEVAVELSSEEHVEMMKAPYVRNFASKLSGIMGEQES